VSKLFALALRCSAIIPISVNNNVGKRRAHVMENRLPIKTVESIHQQLDESEKIVLIV